MPSRGSWNVKNCFLPPDWPPASIIGMKRSREHASALTGAGLKGLLGGLIDAARRDVSRLAVQESVATHQLRVRMKKFLALLRLGQDALSSQTFEAMRMHLRAVKNACAGQRERVVRDKLVTKLASRFQIALPRLSSAAARPVAPPPASFLSHQLCALEQLLDTTRIEALTPEQIVAAHAITYRKGRRMMKQAFDGADETVLHRWRHRVKELHYQTLALDHVPGSARRVRRARKLGSILGRERDLAQLSHDPLCTAARSPWSHVIKDCRSDLRDRMLVLGHKLYDPAAGRFEHKMKRGVLAKAA